MFSRGRFSIVKKCIHKATRKDVAVKFVSKKMKKKEQAAHEAALLQHLQHPQLSLSIPDAERKAERAMIPEKATVPFLLMFSVSSFLFKINGPYTGAPTSF